MTVTVIENGKELYRDDLTRGAGEDASEFNARVWNTVWELQDRFRPQMISALKQELERQALAGSRAGNAGNTSPRILKGVLRGDADDDCGWLKPPTFLDSPWGRHTYPSGRTELSAGRRLTACSLDRTICL